MLNGTSPTSATSKPEQERPPTPSPASQPQTQPVKTSSQSQETPKRMSLGIPQAFSSSGVQIHKVQTAAGFPHSPQPLRPKSHTIGKGKKQAQCVRFFRKKCLTRMNFIEQMQLLLFSSTLSKINCFPFLCNLTLPWLHLVKNCILCSQRHIPTVECRFILKKNVKIKE